MLKTPLYKHHLKLNARMTAFNGWEMPVSYTTVMDEHLATRTAATLFDISHMGEFFIKGKDAYKFLQFILTNDISRLKNGTCCYSTLCNEKGYTLDDLFVYQISNEYYMLVVNAGTIEKDLNHLKNYSNSFELTIENKSNDIAKLDLQGPLSEQILQKITSFPLNTLERFHFIETSVLNKKTTISRTGYTGEDGFELYCDPKDVGELWDKLLEIGKPMGLKPAGLGARDTLRLESSYSLYDHELSEEITPIEAGIGFVVKEKECPYLGKEVLLTQKKNGATKHHICFEMEDRAIPREKYNIYFKNKKMGYVSSGTFSPTFQKGLGMGFINESLEIGTTIDIQIRDTLHPAKIVKRPFYAFNQKKST